MITCKFEHGPIASLRHVVVNVIVFQDNKILLVKRAENLPEGGKWGLPGGFMDRDETLVDAARREVREETGYEINEVKLIRVIDNPQSPREDRQNVTFIYSTNSAKKVAEGDEESSEVRWFTVDELPSEKEFAYDHFAEIQRFLSHLD